MLLNRNNNIIIKLNDFPNNFEIPKDQANITNLKSTQFFEIFYVNRANEADSSTLPDDDHSYVESKEAMKIITTLEVLRHNWKVYTNVFYSLDKDENRVNLIKKNLLKDKIHKLIFSMLIKN